jgi:hypothetical protein
VGWGAEIGTDISKSDESLREVLTEFGVIAAFVAFW